MKKLIMVLSAVLLFAVGFWACDKVNETVDVPAVSQTEVAPAPVEVAPVPAEVAPVTDVVIPVDNQTVPAATEAAPAEKPVTAEPAPTPPAVQ